MIWSQIGANNEAGRNPDIMKTIFVEGILWLSFTTNKNNILKFKLILMPFLQFTIMYSISL